MRRGLSWTTTIALACACFAPAARASVAPATLQRLVSVLGGRPSNAASSRYASLRKLDGHLQGLAADRLEGRSSPSLTTGGLSFSRGRVLVDVYVSGDLAAAADQLRAQGLDVTAVSHHAPERMVEGWLPAGQATDVAGLSAIRAVLPAAGSGVNAGAGTNTGGTLSQGDAVHHGPQARALGANGAGVPVGIISDSIDRAGGGVAASQASGDLPADVQVLQDGDPGDADEGRAMAEIVYDEAPGIPSILFSTGTNGAVGKAASIDSLVAHGAKVIADDTFAITEPFFQDGVVAQAVDRARAAGVAYLVSAGNRARQSWEGTFTLAGDGVSNDFDPGASEDRIQTVTTVGANGTRFIELQWDEPWGAATSSFELDVYSDGVFLGSVSNAAGIPAEFASYSAGGSSHTISIGIKRLSGTGTPHLKYIAGGTARFTVAEHDTSSPAIDPDAASARGALTVAAVDQALPGLNVPEPFSSRGPVTRLFDAAGNRLASADVRAKPDLAAADDVSTSVGASFDPFFGTSASAPSAAGIAALLRSANPRLSIDQLYAIMSAPANAIDCLFPGNPDSDCGAGFLLADRAVAQATDTTPPTIAASTGPTGPTGANGWFRSPVSVLWSATDDGSPVMGATGCGPLMLTTDGVHTLTCSATSVGGAASGTLTVKIDASPPTPPAFSGIAKRAYPVGKLPRKSSLHCTASDPTSGVTGCVLSGYTTASGAHALVATATNGAGLTSTATLRWSVPATVGALKLARTVSLASLRKSGLAVRVHVAKPRTTLVLQLTLTVHPRHGKPKAIVLGRVSKRVRAGTRTLRVTLSRSGRKQLLHSHGATLGLGVLGTLGTTSTALAKSVRATA